MKYFVCSDIHGFYNEWLKALESKGFDINNPNHKCIICGDLFDRGTQPREIIDFILSNKDKFIIIRGNHEDMMADMIRRNRNNSHDLSNGTAYTILYLYPEWQISEFDLRKIAKITKIQEILDCTLDYFETEKYIFIHGWIPINEELQIYDKDWRNAKKEQWEKARCKNPVEMYKRGIFELNKKIVCGHWHCSAFWAYKFPDEYKEFGYKANYEPYIDNNIIALDACTVRSHKVNVLIIED